MARRRPCQRRTPPLGSASPSPRPDHAPASAPWAERQPALDLTPGEYRLPTLNLLTRPLNKAASSRVNAEALEQNARLLESVLDDFGVRGQITNVRPGPVVALYELERRPAPRPRGSSASPTISPGR